MHGAALFLYANTALESARCYHATSTLEAEHFRQQGLRGPIAVVANGPALWPYLKRDRVESRQWLTQAVPDLKDKLILSFLSRVHPQKGTELLVDAWAAVQGDFRDWQLVIAGPQCNGHSIELEARAREKGCAGRLTFLGEVYGSRKATIYSAADLFVLPSFSENFGRVIAEALASAVPVITTTATPWQESFLTIGAAGGSILLSAR